jgi:hypothetical protein
MVLIGYEPGTKAYRLYNPVTDRVHISRDVVFEEGRAWNWVESGTGSSGDGNEDPFVVEYEYVYTRGATTTTPEHGAASRSESRTPSATSSDSGTGQNASASAPAPAASGGARSPAEGETGGASAPAMPTRVEFVSPPSHGVYEDNDNDINVPLRFRRLDDVFAE